jgi:hypothetical protein
MGKGQCAAPANKPRPSFTDRIASGITRAQFSRALLRTGRPVTKPSGADMAFDTDIVSTTPSAALGAGSSKESGSVRSHRAPGHARSDARSVTLPFAPLAYGNCSEIDSIDRPCLVFPSVVRMLLRERPNRRTACFSEQHMDATMTEGLRTHTDGQRCWAG